VAWDGPLRKRRVWRVRRNWIGAMLGLVHEDRPNSLQLPGGRGKGPVAEERWARRPERVGPRCFFLRGTWPFPRCSTRPRRATIQRRAPIHFARRGRGGLRLRLGRPVPVPPFTSRRRQKGEACATTVPH
jgi:hypothetical protein